MINKKDSGATVLHLPLSEKTKPVDGLMTDYCSNIHFFEYLGSSKSTEQITNKLINSNHFEKIKKSLYIGLRKTREHQCPRTSRLSNIPFSGPHMNTAKFKRGGRRQIENDQQMGFQVSRFLQPMVGVRDRGF